MNPHSLGEPFRKSSNAVTARPAIAVASITAISIGCLGLSLYRRVASHIAQAKLNDVVTKGEDDFFDPSMWFATSAYEFGIAH